MGWCVWVFVTHWCATAWAGLRLQRDGEIFLSSLLSARSSLTSVFGQRSCLHTAWKALKVTLMQSFGSLFPQGVPRTQLLDLKANLVLRVQFIRAWKWMWGHVSEELGAKDNTHLVSLRWQGCPSPVISAGCCSCSTQPWQWAVHGTLTWGRPEQLSFLLKVYIPLLWHRQHL